jgi:peptide chain release factor 1
MIKKNEIKIEYMRGTGPGGQNKNKVNSACRVTHIPTGITSYCDERDQGTSRKKAMAELEQRIQEAKDNIKAADKKARRDDAIHNTPIIRTYDFKRGIVKDHKSGKEVSLRKILDKGMIELLR